MKARLHTSIGIAVLPFVLFSCNKVAQDSVPAPAELVTIQASIPQPLTRVAAVEPEGSAGLDWNWEAGDQIAVVSGDNASVFDIRSGFGPKEASFIGKQVSGDSFSILYPGSAATEAGLEALSLAEQTQVGNGNADHLQYFALLSGVDAYDQFSFSEDWAGEHGGSFRQCGVLRISLTLPAETSVVNRIALKAPTPIFHKSNAAEALTDELAVGINEGSLGADHTITAWMTTSWFDDVIPAGTSLTVSVSAGEYNWVCELPIVSDKTIRSGFVNKLTLGEEAGWVSGGRYADGDGTAENPWIIKNAKQLCFVREDLAGGETRYFELASDIDLAGIEWVPLNNMEPFDKFIHFDGKGYTIHNMTITEGVAYASFAGVLYGSLTNVTFSDADITGGEGNKCGIVAGYVGTANALTSCELKDVTVRGSKLTAARSSGIIAGQVATAEAVFQHCRVMNSTIIQTATSTSHCGGFVGYAQADASYIDCSTDAQVLGTEFAGGFAGYIGKGTFQECYASGEVSGTKHVGGFVGKTEVPVIRNCWYDGPSIKATDNTKNTQSGGFVGYAAKSGNFGADIRDCYVKGTSIDAPDGQRVGGFVGQVDVGNTFTKCYVKDVAIVAGQNSAGFVGVDYATPSDDVPGAGIYQCWVDGGSFKANAVNGGGFVAYPEKAVILNCFTTMDVDAGNFGVIGGFIGLCNKNVTVRYCYAAGSVQGTSGPLGGFVGKDAGDETSHVNACIAWNDTLDFAGLVADSDFSGNYAGTEGTLAAKAAELGWDPDIWDFSAKLK